MTSYVIGASVAVLIALAVLVAWRATRRLRRWVQACRHAYLVARLRWMSPGPRREAAILRQRLQAELTYTSAMLTAAPDGLVFRADAQHVLGELTEMALALDNDMRSIEHFADTRQQQAALALVRPQVEQLIKTSYTARQAILRTSAEDRDRQLSRLGDLVEQQSAAAAAYRHGGRGLGT